MKRLGKKKNENLNFLGIFKLFRILEVAQKSTDLIDVFRHKDFLWLLWLKKWILKIFIAKKKKIFACKLQKIFFFFSPVPTGQFWHHCVSFLIFSDSQSGFSNSNFGFFKKKLFVFWERKILWKILVLFRNRKYLHFLQTIKNRSNFHWQIYTLEK